LLFARIGITTTGERIPERYQLASDSFRAHLGLGEQPCQRNSFALLIDPIASLIGFDDQELDGTPEREASFVSCHYTGCRRSLTLPLQQGRSQSGSRLVDLEPCSILIRNVARFAG
jgi:hypothetical protein